MVKSIIYFIQFLIISFPYKSVQENAINYNDLKCLSELPMEKLLKIKKSLQLLSNEVPNSNLSHRIGYDDSIVHTSTIIDQYGNQSIISALPLINNIGYKIRNKVGYSDSSWADEKPSKIQKIFQLSVTSLSFLAFGGYLLCMIVQAIKSKGTTYFHPVTTQAQQPTLYNKKRKPLYNYGYRSKRGINEMDTKNVNQQLSEPSSEDMYKIMILIAEGYVKLQ